MEPLTEAPPLQVPFEPFWGESVASKPLQVVKTMPMIPGDMAWTGQSTATEHPHRLEAMPMIGCDQACSEGVYQMKTVSIADISINATDHIASSSADLPTQIAGDFFWEPLPVQGNSDHNADIPINTTDHIATSSVTVDPPTQITGDFLWEPLPVQGGSDLP